MRIVSLSLLGLILWSSALLRAAPVHPDVEPDTEAPPDDLICELGAEPTAEHVDASIWTGCFGGVGMTISIGGDAITVEPIKDGPAAKAGILSNDRIVKINGEPTQGLGLDEVKNRLRGEPGSTVSLGVLRAGSEIRSCRVQRGVIKLSTVRDAQVLAGKVGYLRLIGFNRFTGVDARESIEQLAKAGARAWVLDVRSNRGGLLRGARDVASRFLEPARAVFVLQRNPPGQRQDYFASRFGPRAGGPVVVLVGSGTAGAAEALAGALRTQRNALVVGSKTFGYGRVVQLLQMPNAPAVLADYGECLLPEGAGLSRCGLGPDVNLGGPGVTMDWTRLWPGPGGPVSLTDDRAVERAVGICLEQLGQPLQ